MQVLYLCDQKLLCGARCTRDKNYMCKHTTDPAHAKNGPCEDPAKHPERFFHTEICDGVDLYTEKSQE